MPRNSKPKSLYPSPPLPHQAEVFSMVKVVDDMCLLGALTYQGYLSGKLHLVTPGSVPLGDRA